MESCRRSDSYNISNFRVWLLFLIFFVGFNEFVSVLAMYSGALLARERRSLGASAVGSSS